MQRFSSVLFLLLLCIACRGVIAGDVNVGAAAVNLVADDSMEMGGSILPYFAVGQEGELRVVAVVIEQPRVAKLAIVACDVLFVTRDIAESAIAEITTSTGIPSHNVLISATHTHHAPSTAVVHGYGREELFCQRLRDAIVLAVQEANSKLSGGEAAFLFHLGEERTVGGNSRFLLSDGTISWTGPRDDVVRPTGPFDPQLPVLAFRGPAGDLRALIYNHSTHTIGTRKGNVRSPSFYGLAAQELERELGGVVAFLEGASGSTHNVTGVPTDEAVRRFKVAINGALQKAEPRPVNRLASIKRRFTFHVRTFDESAEDQKVASYCRKRIPKSAEAVIGVFRDMRNKLKPQQGQTRQTWLQALVIGDVAIVGIPAEFFTGLGLEVKERSPFKETYVAELANDWIGYLPDREAHLLGGYQTWMGLHCYADVGTGERVVDEIIGMLHELKEQ